MRRCAILFNDQWNQLMCTKVKICSQQRFSLEQKLMNGNVSFRYSSGRRLNEKRRRRRKLIFFTFHFLFWHHVNQSSNSFSLKTIREETEWLKMFLFVGWLFFISAYWRCSNVHFFLFWSKFTSRSSVDDKDLIRN